MRRQMLVGLVVALALITFPVIAAADKFIAVYINQNDLSWAMGW